MQMLFHIPDPLAERFRHAVPPRKRSAFIINLLERALPENEDPLYLIALEVERDEALNAEMREWREGLVGDGLRGAFDGGNAHAAR